MTWNLRKYWKRSAVVFSRVQDTIGDKLIPRALTMLAETPSSVLDNLNRAERLGWVDNVDDWLVARELRNRLVHEYITDTKRFAEDLLSAKQYLDMFQQTYDCFLSLAIKHCGVSVSRIFHKWHRYGARDAENIKVPIL